MIGVTNATWERVGLARSFEVLATAASKDELAV
jgi:hypothetical protein